MNWKPDKSKPICPQICEQVCLLVAMGSYAPGQRLPSVRELATYWGVNPNTVQHAMETLELQGILYSVRGTGWFVADDIGLATETLQRLRRERTAEYFRAMEALGMTGEETKNYVEAWKYE